MELSTGVGAEPVSEWRRARTGEFGAPMQRMRRGLEIWRGIGRGSFWIGHGEKVYWGEYGLVDVVARVADGRDEGWCSGWHYMS